MKSPLPTGAKATEVRDGEMQVVNVAGTKVTLTRIDGQLHAFDDTCTHAGCSLAGGDLDGNVVTCRCHGSQFDAITGAVLRGPARSPIRSHPVTTEGDDLLVEL